MGEGVTLKTMSRLGWKKVEDESCPRPRSEMNSSKVE
jgi:hypothetical protein